VPSFLIPQWDPWLLGPGPGIERLEAICHTNDTIIPVDGFRIISTPR
jgi:hypothetical protein